MSTLLLDDLPDELILETIMNATNCEDILKICVTSQKYARICRDNDMLIRRRFNLILNEPLEFACDVSKHTAFVRTSAHNFQNIHNFNNMQIEVPNMSVNINQVLQGIYDDQLMFKAIKLNLLGNVSDNMNENDRGMVLIVPYKNIQKFVYYFISSANGFIGYTIDTQNPQKGYEPNYLQYT
jgi:hypothetical protein